MARTARLERPPAEELARRFAADGFDLAVRRIETGRYIAAATNAALGGMGPVAVGDKAADAVRLAWSRFEAHRGHYLTPLCQDDAAHVGGGTPLRLLRRTRGFSQRRLAAAANLSVSTINRLELDRRAIPTASTRAAISRALGMSAGNVFPHVRR
jgi:DNA-binding XRE family transcriptional regulator